MTLVATVTIPGQTAVLIRVFGRTTRWTDKVSTHGEMAASIKVSSNLIRKMVKAL